MQTNYKLSEMFNLGQIELDGHKWTYCICVARTISVYFQGGAI